MSDGVRLPGVPEAQQDAVLKRYPLRRQRIPIGAGQLSLVLPDDRAWLRKGAWAPAVLRGREPPYWCRIWPAAVCIARQLERAVRVAGEGALADLRVLDLGCGVGVPGVQAAALGARLCSADFEADAVRFAAWNAAAQPGCTHPPTTQLVDWSQGRVEGVFDLVLLSDVTYHETHHVPIRRQLQEVLAPDGCVLHADPCREVSTTFLASLAGDLVSYEWQRRTAFLQHDAVVRMTMLATTPEHLEAWRRRLAAPEDPVDA